VPAGELMRRANELQESNPMLGHRGCRLGISYPEIYEMQARAIFEAQALVNRETGTMPVAEIMVPLVSSAKELELLKTRSALHCGQGISRPMPSFLALERMI